MKKTLTIVLAFVLVIAMSVAGTFAYLTSQDSVTNTFTVGKVKITLDEAKTSVYGVVDATATARVKANEYKLIAGHEYAKAPIVHVDADSESCWLFIKVEDGIAALEADTTIAAQLAAAGWTPVAAGSNIYAYKEVVASGANVPTFATFKILGTKTETELNAFKDAKIVVTAFAVQADGFATSADAYAANTGVVK